MGEFKTWASFRRGRGLDVGEFKTWARLDVGEFGRGRV